MRHSTSSAPNTKQIGFEWSISPNVPEACSDKPMQIAPSSFILVIVLGSAEQRTIFTCSVAPEAIREKPGPRPKFPLAEIRIASLRKRLRFSL